MVGSRRRLPDGPPLRPMLFRDGGLSTAKRVARDPVVLTLGDPVGREEHDRNSAVPAGCTEASRLDVQSSELQI